MNLVQNKAYKFRLYPNKQQQELINMTFGCTRFVFNRILGDAIKYYEENKKTKINTPATYKSDYPFLKEVVCRQGIFFSATLELSVPHVL